MGAFFCSFHGFCGSLRPQYHHLWVEYVRARTCAHIHTSSTQSRDALLAQPQPSQWAKRPHRIQVDARHFPVHHQPLDQDS